MAGERRSLAPDLCERGLDCLRDHQPRALRVRRRLSGRPPRPTAAVEVLAQRLPLRPQLRRTSPWSFRRTASASSSLRSPGGADTARARWLVEERAGVAESAPVRRLDERPLRGGRPAGGREHRRQRLLAGMRQKVRDVVEPLGVLDPDHAPSQRYRPVVAFATEYGRASGTRVCRTLSLCRRASRPPFTSRLAGDTSRWAVVERLHRRAPPGPPAAPVPSVWKVCASCQTIPWRRNVSAAFRNCASASLHAPREAATPASARAMTPARTSASFAGGEDLPVAFELRDRGGRGGAGDGYFALNFERISGRISLRQPEKGAAARP